MGYATQPLVDAENGVRLDVSWLRADGGWAVRVRGSAVAGGARRGGARPVSVCLYLGLDAEYAPSAPRGAIRHVDASYLAGAFDGVGAFALFSNGRAENGGDLQPRVWGSNEQGAVHRLCGPRRRQRAVTFSAWVS